MGVAATNLGDRVLASLGNLAEGAPVVFEPCDDLSKGGVLTALPALLACGLLRYSAKYFHLPKGYYTLSNIFLLFGFMPLNRVHSIEALRRQPPGEWGKILGLDRVPVAETLREKLKLITRNEKSVQSWAADLARDWMEDEGAQQSVGGLLYLVDGHVRVYHGSQTKLPRHYVARQRLCLRATTDYWVNQSDGAPVFKINQAVDPGMVKVLREEIIPRLEADVPNQPSPAQQAEDPLLPRLTVVFDREGYSPELFRHLWKEKRIACQTYRKGAYEPWDDALFTAREVVLNNGRKVTWELAEMGTLLGAKKDEPGSGIWVREIRKKSQRGHQTAILSTNFKLSAEAVAARQFGRWSQENFFRYASQSFDLDRLVDYELGMIPDTVEVINPRWREFDGQVRKLAALGAKRRAEFGGLTLEGEIEPDKVEDFFARKSVLQTEIEELDRQLTEVKAARRGERKKVPLSELSEEERFLPLNQRGKHFIDTIKIVAYRAETVVAQILAEKMNAHHRDEARRLARQIFQSEINLRPDLAAKTLTVQIHGMSTPRDDLALEHLCEELTATETIYPGTELRMVYRKVSN